MRRRILNSQELIKQNREELLSDQKALEKIEKRLEEKRANNKK